MKTIEIQIRDDVEIENFLDALMETMNSKNAALILSMAECPSILSSSSNADDDSKRQMLGDFKGGFVANPQLNCVLSDWLVAAEREGYFPLMNFCHGSSEQMPLAVKDEQGS